MADDTKSWLIILALQAQLQGIAVANGYRTDAGKAVWTEPKQRDASAALGISIATQHIDRWPGERPNKRGRELLLTIEAAISTDLDNAHQLAHQLIGDVEDCLEKSAAAGALPAVPGVKPFEVESSEVANQPEGAPFIGVAMIISAGYLR